MKKSILLITICFLSVTVGYSQDWSNYRIGVLYPGYVIKNDGTKIEGYIYSQIRASALHLGLWNDNQTRVAFYTDPQDRNSRMVFTPEDLKEYMINGKIYRSMNFSGGLSSRAMRFLLLVRDGRISQYVWYENIGTDTHPNFREKTVIRRGTETPIEISTLTLNFSRRVSELVRGYPELAARVARRERGYRLLNLFQIIEKYNEWYSQKNN